MFISNKGLEVENNLGMLISNNRTGDFYILNPSIVHPGHRDLLFSIYYIICTLVYKVIKI